MYEKDKPKVGKPRKWKSKEALIKLINEYLEITSFDEYSITGLAYQLGTSRQLLIDYENRPEYRDIIKEAKLIIEHSYEISLRKNGRTGDIFALKNFDWKDKTEVDQKTEHSGSIGGILNDISKNKDNLKQYDRSTRT